jgi:tetratricopeptide (TPR) repeat protein
LVASFLATTKKSTGWNTMLIDPPKPLSQSLLWEYQRNYFNTAGINAWANQVPFYVTSNPFIANVYATLFIEFARDWTAQHPDAINHTFYLLELGTGSGRFSFYVLKKIKELCRQFNLNSLRFCYVMSDFTEPNIHYWETHPALHDFLHEGLLDFAVYNMECDTRIQLMRQAICLDPETLQNPLTVFGNYIFDTVTQDAFSVQNGELSELLISLKADPNNLNETGEVLDWSKLELGYQAQALDCPRYEDRIINTVLNEYRTHLQNSHFLFPIGGLAAIKNLLTLANDKLFLVSSDKGYSSLASLENLSFPKPSFHGSFSMMVNFHAIARYFKLRGGDYHLQTPREGLRTVAFAMGFNFESMPATQSVIQQHIEGLSPADYFTLHKRVRDHFEEYDLATLTSHLIFAAWDPHIYLKINSRLCQLAAVSSDQTTLHFLSSHLYKIMDNFYNMPGFGNVPFELGTLFYSFKAYQKALKYYLLSEPFNTEKFGFYYNVGLCQYYLGQLNEALGQFKQALILNPDSSQVQEWIAFLEK